VPWEPGEVCKEVYNGLDERAGQLTFGSKNETAGLRARLTLVMQIESRSAQRGRGRRGGRAARGRGRMRKRGLSGGGTLRRKSPQQGQRPSSEMGPVASARSQWPRASHTGLMHCTVKPGKYCMRAPSLAGQICGRTTVCAAEAPRTGPDRIDGVNSAVVRLWCQGKRLQGIVVGLPHAKGEG